MRNRLVLLTLLLLTCVTISSTVYAETTGDVINRVYHTSIAALDRSALEADLFTLEMKINDLVVIEQNNALETEKQNAMLRLLSSRVEELTEISVEFSTLVTEYRDSLETLDLDWIVHSRVNLQSYMRAHEIDYSVGVNAEQMIFEPTILAYQGDSLQALTMQVGMINARLRSLDNSINYGDVPTSYPTEGEVSSGFGSRSDPLTGEPSFHTGVDISAPQGTPVRSWFNGTVIKAENSGGWGNHVVVKQGDLQVLYAHLNKITVKVGTQIYQNSPIGEVGSTGRSTGNHLHLGLYINEVAVDPAKLLKDGRR